MSGMWSGRIPPGYFKRESAAEEFKTLAADMLAMLERLRRQKPADALIDFCPVCLHPMPLNESRCFGGCDLDALINRGKEELGK